MLQHAELDRREVNRHQPGARGGRHQVSVSALQDPQADLDRASRDRGAVAAVAEALLLRLCTPFPGL